MMAGVKATYWAVIGADKRVDNSTNCAQGQFGLLSAPFANLDQFAPVSFLVASKAVYRR